MVRRTLLALFAALLLGDAAIDAQRSTYRPPPPPPMPRMGTGGGGGSPRTAGTPTPRQPRPANDNARPPRPANDNNRPSGGGSTAGSGGTEARPAGQPGRQNGGNPQGTPRRTGPVPGGPRSTTTAANATGAPAAARVKPAVPAKDSVQAVQARTVARQNSARWRTALRLRLARQARLRAERARAAARTAKERAEDEKDERERRNVFAALSAGGGFAEVADAPLAAAAPPPPPPPGGGGGGNDKTPPGSRGGGGRGGGAGRIAANDNVRGRAVVSGLSPLIRAFTNATRAEQRRMVGDWYRQSGVPENEIASYVEGTDLNKPVLQPTLKQKERVEVWVIKGSQAGRHFTRPGTDPYTLGIVVEAREKQVFEIQEDVEVIETTAADFPTTEANIAMGLGGKGGGQQFIMPAGWQQKLKRVE